MAPYDVWKPYGKLFKVYAAFEEYVFEDQWLSASGRAMPSPAPAAISPSVLGGCQQARAACERAQRAQREAVLEADDEMWSRRLTTDDKRDKYECPALVEEAAMVARFDAPDERC